jgi:Mg2+-importing ATPase
MIQLPSAFWCVSATEILQGLQTAREGLTGAEARQRLARYGPNLLKPPKRSDLLTLLLAQFKSPLILILLFATGLSFVLHDPVNALIILTIVLVSGLLGFWQEHGATDAVEKLLAMVQVKATVLRDGSPMITFGLVSSVFDYLTFGALLTILHATQDQFRTGWFLESVISASLIVLVIRSRKPFFKSRPSKYLLMTTLLVVIVTVILPFTPMGEIFGFPRLSISFHLLLAVIVVFYIVTAEITKTIFYQKIKF